MNETVLCCTCNPRGINPSSRRTATLQCKYTACSERSSVVLLQLDPENPRASALKESIVTDREEQHQARDSKAGACRSLDGDQHPGVWRAFLPNTLHVI